MSITRERQYRMTATKHRTYTIEQIKQANGDAGGYWFSPDTMRFFRTRLGRTTYGPDSEGRVYFTTSEQFDAFAPRLHTVRKFDPRTGAVGTHSDFQEFATGREAAAAARKAARR